MHRINLVNSVNPVILSNCLGINPSLNLSYTRLSPGGDCCKLSTFNGSLNGFS